MESHDLCESSDDDEKHQSSTPKQKKSKWRPRPKKFQMDCYHGGRFKVPDSKQRYAAIGLEHEDNEIVKALTPIDKFFPAIKAPKPGFWLQGKLYHLKYFLHKNSLRSLNDSSPPWRFSVILSIPYKFLQSNVRDMNYLTPISNKNRNKVYLQPLGTFDKDRSPSIDHLKQFATAYLGVEVIVLPPHEFNSIKSRMNQGVKQLCTRHILTQLRKSIPNDGKNFLWHNAHSS